MRPRKQIDIRTEQRTSPDRDRTSVNEDTVGVDKDTVSKPHVEAIVRFDGSLDPRFVLEQLVVCYRVVETWWKRGFVLDDAGLSCLDLYIHRNRLGRFAVMPTHSLHSSTRRRRATSSVLLNRLQAYLQRIRAAVRSGVKAW